MHDARSWTAQTLDNTQVRYAWGEPWGDLPTAEFTFAVQPGQLAVSARVVHTGSVLQVVSHGALPGSASVAHLAEVDELNQQLGMTRAYFNDRSGKWDVSGGIYAPQRPASADALGILLAMIYDHRDLLDAPQTSPSHHLGSMLTPLEVMPGVAMACDALGWSYSTQYEGEMISVQLKLDDEFLTHVSWFLLDGMLMARAQPVGVEPVHPAEDVHRRLNRLNSRLDIGGVGLRRDLAIPYGWVAHPVELFEATPESVAWTTEHASSYAMHAYRTALG